ncbi:hypothetical protein D3C73_563580 [compost metagenome]
MHRRPALPPCRIIVIFGDLDEAELLVVIGTDEFGSVDRALFERGINVAAGNLLRRHADLRHHLAGKPGNAHLQALEIVDGDDFLAEPAAHLRAAIAGRQGVETAGCQEFVDQVVAAIGKPGIGHAGVEAEGNGGSKRKGRILADIIVGAGMRHLDRAVGDRIGGLQARHQFAGCIGLDVEIAVGCIANDLGKLVAGAEDDVEALREGGRHAPGDLWLFLGNCRRRQCRRRCRADACRRRLLEEMPAIHRIHPPAPARVCGCRPRVKRIDLARTSRAAS